MGNLKLDNSKKVNPVSVTPEIDFIQEDLDIVLSLSSSYRNENFLISASLVAHPDNYNGYLYYRITGSALPEFEGQYVARTQERINEGYRWELITDFYDSASFTWDAITGFHAGLTYSTDTAYVEGTNELTITRYNG
jgi:hypothetical protein